MPIWILSSAAIFGLLRFVGQKRGHPLASSDSDYSIPDYRKWKTDELRLITGKRFTNEAVEIDGKAFAGCEFDNATFIYHGVGPTSFAPDCRFQHSSLIVKSDNQAVMGFSQLSEIVRNIAIRTGKTHTIEIGLQRTSGKTDRLRIESITPGQESNALRGKIPRIAPAGHGNMIPGQWQGLIIVNDGEPAYDVSFGSIHIGKSAMVFTRGIQRLTKEDGKAHCEYWIKQDSGTDVPGGLFEEMVRYSIDAVDLPIRYKDGNNQWYETTVKLERDVMAPTGIYTRYVVQKKITQPV